MKTIPAIIAFITVVLTAGATHGEEDKDLSEASKVGILPHQKKTLSVPPDERNPFSVPVTETGSAIIDSSTEEAQLRAIIRGLQVEGVTPGNRGLKVLMGGMIVEQGQFVPDLIPSQTNRLLISKISRKEIELTVVDEDGAEQQEKIRKEFDIDNELKAIYPGGQGRSQLHALDLPRHTDRVKSRNENRTLVTGESPQP
jgi:hypothetical protein